MGHYPEERIVNLPGGHELRGLRTLFGRWPWDSNDAAEQSASWSPRNPMQPRITQRIPLRPGHVLQDRFRAILAAAFARLTYTTKKISTLPRTVFRGVGGPDADPLRFPIDVAWGREPGKRGALGFVVVADSLLLPPRVQFPAQGEGFLLDTRFLAQPRMEETEGTLFGLDHTGFLRPDQILLGRIYPAESWIDWPQVRDPGPEATYQEFVYDFHLDGQARVHPLVGDS